MKYNLYRTWNGGMSGQWVASYWTSESAYNAMASLMKIPTKYSYFIEVPLYVDLWYNFLDFLNNR